MKHLLYGYYDKLGYGLSGLLTDQVFVQKKSIICSESCMIFGVQSGEALNGIPKFLSDRLVLGTSSPLILAHSNKSPGNRARGDTYKGTKLLENCFHWKQFVIISRKRYQPRFVVGIIWKIKKHFLQSIICHRVILSLKDFNF